MRILAIVRNIEIEAKEKRKAKADQEGLKKKNSIKFYTYWYFLILHFKKNIYCSNSATPNQLFDNNIDMTEGLANALQKTNLIISQQSKQVNSHNFIDQGLIIWLMCYFIQLNSYQFFNILMSVDEKVIKLESSLEWEK